MASEKSTLPKLTFAVALPLFALLLAGLPASAQQPDLLTPFEKDTSNTATYDAAIAYYQRLDGLFGQLQVREWGLTDAGKPLHLAVLSKDGVFEPEKVHAAGKAVIFINNAIHPGEPEGVDATMMLFRDLLQKPDFQPFLDNVVVVAVPFYNIDGGLNRGCCSRANQNGPAEYGFRGNAKNLDLNRDFVKCDSKNAQSFARAFQRWRPDVLVDNHTSNGADYPYTMTMLTTQEDKLGEILGGFLRREMLPQLYAAMAQRGQEICPYVNEMKDTPADGIYGFYDSPRYSSGFAALHHCIGFVPEAHMLKPFPQRVRATYDFMEVLIRYVNANANRIKGLRKQQAKADMAAATLPLDWQVDEERADSIFFKGFAGKYKPSEVTGLDRLWYDRSERWEKMIPYWNHFTPKTTVTKPIAYLIPQAYTEVVDRLRWNGVEVKRLQSDLTAGLEMYRIKDFKTRNAYEGHYLHYEVQVEKSVEEVAYREGDFVVFTGQPTDRFLVEMLEPQAIDSYFAWNFFDGVLMEKEYFSPYVFEDMAAEFLRQNPSVRQELEAKRQADPAFAKSQWEQLFFVYQRTPYFEQTYRRYPVARLVDPAVKLDL